MANDIMIDLETLDTSPYCVILTIGAVRFNPKGNGVAERLELRPTIEEQTENSDAYVWLHQFNMGLKLLDEYDHESLDSSGKHIKKMKYPSISEYMDLVDQMR
jgi:hypothetical protein